MQVHRNYTQKSNTPLLHIRTGGPVSSDQYLVSFSLPPYSHSCPSPRPRVQHMTHVLSEPAAQPHRQAIKQVAADPKDGASKTSGGNGGRTPGLPIEAFAHTVQGKRKAWRTGAPMSRTHPSTSGLLCTPQETKTDPKKKSRRSGPTHHV